MLKRWRNKTKVEIVLSILVVMCAVRKLFEHDYFSVFLCILTLVLFALPKIIEKKLNISIPTCLESIILIFIFSAEILGEINAFYAKIPGWDTILHTTNGFLMAAIGFAMIDIFNRSERFSIKMSPYFVAFTAFCFSMTVGVLWEFFEFGMDCFFGTDMQNDWIIHSINTYMLNPADANAVGHLKVESVLINGKDLGLGGYLDIGLIDTMKDLIVNFIGAVVFSVIGVFYLKHRKAEGIISSFVPVINEDKEEE